MSDGINTGMQRAVELIVAKRIYSTVANDYPRTYLLGQAFGTYLEVAENELAEMPIEDYMKRLKDFKEYVESVEMGSKVDLNSAYTKNTDLCPLPEL